MFALTVLWDLSTGTRAGIDQLRTYIRDESLDKFRARKDLVQKVWISNSETNRWGAFYLFETREAAEEQARTVTKPEIMTGIKPTVELFEVEAAVEGLHSGANIFTSGLVWTQHTP